MSLSSRQRIVKTLNHEPVDHVPVDFGGTVLSGAHISIVAKMRQALGLDTPDTPVKVSEPAQMLGEVAADLQQKLGLDVAWLPGPGNVFGFAQKDWKPWRTFDGTNVLVAGQFNTEPDEKGNILQYPQADKSVPAGAKMPKDGFYFDAIIRQKPIVEEKLNPMDNTEEFVIISDEDLAIWQSQADDLYNNTDMAISAGFPGTGFGDVFLVPAPFLKDPKGIRDIEEWYISTITRKGYIKEMFDYQTEIAIKNLKLMHQAVGNKVNMVFIDGTDLAAQTSLFCSPDAYREMYLPHHKAINDWIHANTEWKPMKHCCGACEPLITAFIDAGFDVLNPVQCSATGMDPQMLVDKYGDDIVFWGAGVDTQKTLPFGNPDEVRREVKERVRIFSQKNGFVFTAIHNIQCNTPLDNVLAMFETLNEIRA